MDMFFMQRLIKSLSNKRINGQFKAQAIVEFAIALPVLLMLLVGILEVGRMIFVYAAVNNASREASRFGSAVGYDDSGLHKYKHCAGIRDMARRSAWFLNLQPADITIQYMRPAKDANGNDVVVSGVLSETTLPYVCDAVSGEDPDVSVLSGDRVTVTVTANYSPMVNLVPITSRTFTSTSARTILGIFDLD
jgi:Flp pilus assembly protein TadG